MNARTSRYGALALGLALVAWLFTSTLHRAGPTETRTVARSDLPVYLAAARVVQEGADPFGVQSERGWPYVYPPTLAVLLTPLTSLPQRVAAGIWFWISLALMVAGMLAFRKACGERGGFGWIADGLPLLFVILPIASCLERGQVGALLLGLCGLGFGAFQKHRRIACALTVGLATAIKTTPGLLLVAIAASRRMRTLGATLLALGMWLVLIPAPYLGVKGAVDAAYHQSDQTLLRYAREPEAAQLTETSQLDIHITTNQSLASQVIRRTQGRLQKALLLLLSLGILAPLFVALQRRALPHAEAWGLALAATLLLSPVAWHHHHVLLWPALYLLVMRRREPYVAWILGLFFALSTLHFVGKNTALGEAGLLGLGTLLVYGTLLLRSNRKTPNNTEPTSTTVPIVS